MCAYALLFYGTEPRPGLRGLFFSKFEILMPISDAASTTHTRQARERAEEQVRSTHKRVARPLCWLYGWSFAYPAHPSNAGSRKEAPRVKKPTRTSREGTRKHPEVFPTTPPPCESRSQQQHLNLALPQLLRSWPPASRVAVGSQGTGPTQGVQLIDTVHLLLVLICHEVHICTQLLSCTMYVLLGSFFSFPPHPAFSMNLLHNPMYVPVYTMYLLYIWPPLFTQGTEPS